MNIIEQINRNLKGVVNMELKLMLNSDIMNRLKSSDGVIEISLGAKSKTFLIVEENDVKSPGTLTASIISRLENPEIQGMIVVANYITPDMKHFLRRKGVHYLERAGNLHIEDPDFLIAHIEGLKTRDFRVRNKRRVFKTAGMKLILAFLVDPSLVSETYQVMADRAGISSSSIGVVLDELEELGFLSTGKSDRELVNPKGLLDRWIQLYPFVIRESQLIGRYRLKDGVEIPDGLTFSGRPRVESIRDSSAMCIYSEASTKELSLYFESDDDGPIEILRPFWKNDYLIQPDRWVHPILNYADLISHERYDLDDAGMQSKLKSAYNDIVKEINTQNSRKND